MTKTLRKIGQVIAVCLLLSTASLMAQSNVDLADIYPDVTKLEMAKERFETTHNVVLSDAEFIQKLTAAEDATNLAEWNTVLASYTREEIKTQLQANPTRVTSNGVESDSDYFFIREIVKRLQRDLN